MQILVTGGTGLIGRHWLASRPQDQFTVFTRQIAPSKLPSNITIINSLDHLPSLDGYDAVVNLAGEPIVGKRWSPSTKAAIRNSRIATTQKLVQMILSCTRPPTRLISGSAIGVYGNTGSQAVDEHATIDPNPRDFAQTLCLDWEAQALAAQKATAVSLLRTGIVLSRAGGALAKMLPAFKLGLGGRLGDGKQWMSWVHIEDTVAVINHLIDGPEFRGPINLTSPHSVTNRFFTQQLAQHCRRPGILPVPSWALNLLLGEASQLLLDSQQVVPKNLIDHGFSFSYPQLSGAFDHLLQH